MTILAAILCRIGGHKPYEHPHILWGLARPGRRGFDGTPVMLKRCKRCGKVLGNRPMRRDEEPIEA